MTSCYILCARFDSKNCTIHEGLMAMNGTCFHRGDVDDSQWTELKQTSMDAKLPADEFFQ